MLTMKRLVGSLSLGAAALYMTASAHAATTSDQAAAVVIYPKIVFNIDPPTDTIVEIANTSNATVDLHCFYVNATGHCSNSGIPCDSGVDCGGTGSCIPGWAETDFSVALTRNQPFYWLASTGRNRSCDANDTCEPLPLIGLGVCQGGNPICTSNFDCGPGGICNLGGGSNAGTAVPPVPEDEFFVGELKCVAVDGQGNPTPSNSVIGTATIVTDFGDDLVDAQSYNAIGVRANSRCDGDAGILCRSDADCGGDGPCVPAVVENGVLILGSDTNPEADYQACPETLILDHIFDGAPDPIGPGNFYTDLTLIPCSEDFAVGTANLGRSTAQFLVFNEFEQRFSSSLPVTCFEERLLSNIDTRNNDRSIFSVNVSGTIAGQSRIRPVGSGLLGVARAMKSELSLEEIATSIREGGLPPVFAPGAAYELHQQGQRDAIDEIVLP